MNKKMRDQEKQGSAYSAFDLAQIHFGSGINVLAGVWLLIAPGFLGYPRPISRWNDILRGCCSLSWRYSDTAIRSIASGSVGSMQPLGSGSSQPRLSLRLKSWRHT